MCDAVRDGYSDALIAAHFEVPGEMFRLAMDAKGRGRGVVGSTSNILDFIVGKVCPLCLALWARVLQRCLLLT